MGIEIKGINSNHWIQNLFYQIIIFFPINHLKQAYNYLNLMKQFINLKKIGNSSSRRKLFLLSLLSFQLYQVTKIYLFLRMATIQIQQDFYYSQNESHEFQCSLESSIELNQKDYWGYIYGTLSDDGRLLIVQDYASMQIQIRTQAINN
ncbi:unnamed protein product [Paramecium octaurelia]|uniref:Uncharacterized protein n=1 Tax=Paramecium octaurelia TaxID=43137 RepID=A0A8S1YQC3_PAROT|nr:unnamed protein product [Paramecium octaurelia]